MIGRMVEGRSGILDLLQSLNAMNDKLDQMIVIMGDLAKAGEEVAKHLAETERHRVAEKKIIRMEA